MAKRLFLAVLVLLFGFNAFSQLQGSGTELDPYLIEDVADFDYFKDMISEATQGKYFKQTADIDLGSRNLTSAIVAANFDGIYDGDSNTITYQATFTTSGQGTSYAIFGGVYGTIKNLNVNGNITVSGGGQDLRCALLCGYLNGGTIESCNVIGNVNSTADVGTIGSAGTGLIVGRCDGTIQYCTGSGNVTGPGYVGGIAGQLGGLVAFNQSGGGHVKGCSFVGSVTATPGGWTESALLNLGSFAGGICGFATNSSIIELCYVKADIVATEVTTGVGGTTPSGWESYFVGGKGKPTVRNNYCEGTVNGNEIDTQAEITNSYGTVSGNYYGGQKSAQDIADSLNNAAAGDEKINFDVVDGEVVFGKVNKEKVCETPNNLSISNIDGVYTAIWHNPGADDTMEEGEWHLRLTGGNDVDYYSTINNTTISSPLPPSPNPYVFTVYTYCPLDNSDSIISQEVSATFGVACPIPTNLQVTDLSYNSFVATWQSNADCQLTVNENAYTISQSNSMSQMITGLTPETEYSVSVKAKCGGDYLEEITTIATTTKIPAPTNLMVSTVWNETSGSATMTWELPEGFLFEVETENNPEMSQQISDAQYSISNLAPGSYTAKVRATKEINSTIYYSDWVEVPYTISAIPAPSNPQITFTPQQDGKVEVKVDWSAGSNESVSWEVKVGDVIFALTTNSPTHTFTQREAGETFVVKISERIGESQSEALVVPITVPCSQAIVPNSILTTQTSVTMNWETANANRKVIIDTIEYTVDETTITISGLEVGTPYTYEVREYCLNDNYSSENGIFTTVGCHAVKDVSASEIGVKNARITWKTQSSLDNLNYNVVLKQGETVVLEEIQTIKSKSFTNLSPSTTYVVEIQEQCGEGWGAKSTFTFTTESGSYVSAGDGLFNEPSTWVGGKAPKGDVGTITISTGDIVTLSHSLVLKNDCQIINDGVLRITQQGELINTTDNNVGGIVEIETPIKEKNNWTFIGAPFAGYKLECIKPAPSADISISKYDYTQGDWSNEWATVSTEMEVAEGYFAWPFYRGVVTYTTYGDVCVKNEDTKKWEEKPYDFNKEPATALNNVDVIITKNVQGNTSTGRWMALSNPYPAKLSVNKFVAANTNIAEGTEGSIQGQCIYKLTNNVSNNKQTWDVVFANNANETVKDIAMTEGFFVNLESGDSITFSKDQLTNYPTTKAKSQTNPTEFIELSLVKGNHKSKLYFAHNQEAEQNYDIFDANKLFALGEIAEPYFVTDGTALVKEEVKELPYYATMNVRSFADDTVSFVVENIPEGYYVYLIDNGERIKMHEQIGYLTQIAEGENEDRFKVLVTKTILEDSRAASNIEITNYNREITIESEVENLEIEVYNALGQKVFATKDYNFILNEVPAGAYLVKAFSGKVRQTTKIVVK